MRKKGTLSASVSFKYEPESSTENTYWKKKFDQSTNLVVAGCHSHMLLSEHYKYTRTSIYPRDNPTYHTEPRTPRYPTKIE